MNVVENDVFDDVGMNLFLRENVASRDKYKLNHDVERFEMEELKMIDWLNQMYDDVDDWHEVYVHEVVVVLNKTKDFHQMNDPKNVDQYLIFREMPISVYRKQMKV